MNKHGSNEIGGVVVLDCRDNIYGATLALSPSQLPETPAMLAEVSTSANAAEFPGAAAWSNWTAGEVATATSGAIAANVKAIRITGFGDYWLEPVVSSADDEAEAAKYLSKTDAASVYLTKAGTAADSNKLGGLVAANYMATNGTAFYSANDATEGVTVGGSAVAGRNLVVLNMTGTLTAGAALTLPTGAAIVASLGSLAIVGFKCVLRVMNTGAGAFAWTVTGNTGVTVSGTATVDQGKWRDFVLTYSATNTFTLQSIGSGIAD